MIRSGIQTTLWLAFGASLALSASTLSGQDFPGGGDIPGGGTGGDQQVPDTGGGNVPGQQAEQLGEAEVQNLGDFINQFNLEPEEVEIENQRLQPFVGPSRAAFSEQGVSHPRSQIDQAAGGGGGAGFGGGRGQGAPATSDALEGFEVPRAGIRSRLVPRIEVRFPVSAATVGNRFQQRLTRIPAINSAAAGVNVSVQNRVATLSGTVATSEIRDRIERMARLEPGISRIVNQITVTGQ